MTDMMDIADVKRELAEARAQQAATASVLHAISQSSGNIDSVLLQLVEAVANLCDAEMASLSRHRGTSFYEVIHHGLSEAHIAHMRDFPIQADRGTVVGRVLLTGEIVQIGDARADPEFSNSKVLELDPIRTMLGFPLKHAHGLAGVIVLFRKTVRPFTAQQLKMLQVFADQAVIAIENARLFEAEQTRTKELAESLEYQTATSDVLGVISRSPNDVQPVLDTIAQTAQRLC